MSPKKSIHTPKSRVKSALRTVWLRSRERARALKRENYTCECCGKKQSKRKGQEVKLEVHHRLGVLNWGAIMNAVYKYLLCPAEELEVLCTDCHSDKEILKKKAINNICEHMSESKDLDIKYATIINDNFKDLI